MADRIVTPDDDFSHSKRIPLSVLEKKLERDTRLITKALHTLSVEDPESTHTEAGAVSGLLNHWLVNRELGYYINGQRGDDFTALTVPVNGDYDKGLAAMEAWITIDKQELVELLRSRGFTVSDNLLNPQADRTPNWDKWRLIPKLTASQCAALWANIDPDKLRYDGFKGFMESQEFKDRLDLVQANLYGALKSKNSKVDLRLFAAWVRDQGREWDAPAELLAMADQRPQNVDWDYWGTLDLWPLDAACKLISGYDPHEPTRREDIENRDANRPKWVNVYHQAQSSQKAGNLSITDGEEVKPAEFLAWAREKAYPVQRELEEAVNRFHRRFEDRQEAAWEGFDPDSDTYPPELDIALQAWRAITNRRDSSKTAKEQIREWLEAHYPKLSEVAKERIAVVCNWEKGGGKPRRERNLPTY